MKYWVIASVIIVGSIWTALATIGDGGFRRMVTISGIYSICRPDNYEVVCFLDADGKEGGMFCMPLAAATKDGACRK